MCNALSVRDLAHEHMIIIKKWIEKKMRESIDNILETMSNSRERKGTQSESGSDPEIEKYQDRHFVAQSILLH